MDFADDFICCNRWWLAEVLLKVGLWLLLLWRCVKRDKKNTGERDKENREERKRVRRRERWIKIIIKFFSIYVRTVLNIEGYCSMLQNFDTFRTPYEAWIVVFGVSNAKYFAFEGRSLIVVAMEVRWERQKEHRRGR